VGTTQGDRLIEEAENDPSLQFKDDPVSKSSLTKNINGKDNDDDEVEDIARQSYG
jgi:hypothetical protein